MVWTYIMVCNIWYFIIEEVICVQHSLFGLKYMFIITGRSVLVVALFLRLLIPAYPLRYCYQFYSNNLIRKFLENNDMHFLHLNGNYIIQYNVFLQVVNF